LTIKVGSLRAPSTDALASSSRGQQETAAHGEALRRVPQKKTTSPDLATQMWESMSPSACGSLAGHLQQELTYLFHVEDQQTDRALHTPPALHEDRSLKDKSRFTKNQ
jgi:hypothetical protein